MRNGPNWFGNTAATEAAKLSNMGAFLTRLSSRAFASLVLVCAAVAAVVAQQPGGQQKPTFGIGTQTVSVFATVTDAQNRLVPDLVEADFEILDNDKVQALTLFESEVRPITVVVMLDTSASMTSAISLLKTAAEQFLIRLLPEDKGIVGAFNDKIEVSGEFTANRDHLIASVRDLDYGNGTRLYDAIAEGITLLQDVDGRKVVLVFTDGEDTTSRIGRGTVLERARNDEVMIYAIGLESRMLDQISKPDGGLKRLAEETGGGYFELKRTSELGPTFTRVAQELHSQYSLGFQPKQLDGKVHKLAVRMKQAGLSARARKSYVATAAQSPSEK